VQATVRNLAAPAIHKIVYPGGNPAEKSEIPENCEGVGRMRLVPTRRERLTLNIRMLSNRVPETASFSRATKLGCASISQCANLPLCSMK
jgi:hypothetical protein